MLCCRVVLDGGTFKTEYHLELVTGQGHAVVLIAVEIVYVVAELEPHPLGLNGYASTRSACGVVLDEGACVQLHFSVSRSEGGIEASTDVFLKSGIIDAAAHASSPVVDDFAGNNAGTCFQQNTSSVVRGIIVFDEASFKLGSIGAHRLPTDAATVVIVGGAIIHLQVAKTARNRTNCRIVFHVAGGITVVVGRRSAIRELASPQRCLARVQSWVAHGVLKGHARIVARRAVMYPAVGHVQKHVRTRSCIVFHNINRARIATTPSVLKCDVGKIQGAALDSEQRQVRLL